ncbi:MAG TPA: NAD-dependent deacylase [Actinomycetota bacterium]|nr:NAD-dependent deacylase [Actinomycetota bacterium]
MAEVRPNPSEERTIEEIAGAIGRATNVVVLSGAGISTESGIPDFRGPNGVWTKDPKAERMATLQHYMADPELRVQAWQARMNHPAWQAQPNNGHVALAELERKGKLQTLVTQNVDGLHQLAGTSPAILIEIHGTMREVNCMSCGERAPMEKALERVRDGESDPPCRTCGGILKSATISFGQNLIQADLHRAHQAAGTADVFIAIGTSLAVYPVAYLPRMALDNGARLLIVNAEPTGLDGEADWVIQRPIGDALPEIVALV